MRVEFYYDLVSPYSYLAYGQIGRICEENGAALVLRPMLLGAVHKEAGIKGPGRDEAQGQIPGAQHPSLGRVLRGCAHFP